MDFMVKGLILKVLWEACLEATGEDIAAFEFVKETHN